MNRFVCALITSAVVSIGAAGCAVQHSGDSLSPSPTASYSAYYVGTWKSSVVSAPTGSTCGNFEWRVTNQSQGIISGVFLAQCGGGLVIG